MFRTRPRQPSRMPTQEPPSLAIRCTTARITAFRPGQSPPPVSKPTFMKVPGIDRSAGAHAGRASANIDLRHRRRDQAAAMRHYQRDDRGSGRSRFGTSGRSARQNTMNQVRPGGMNGTEADRRDRGRSDDWVRANSRRRRQLRSRLGGGPRRRRRGRDALDPGGVDPALDEVAVAEDPAVERDRGLDALDDQLVEGPPHDGDRLGAGRGVDDQLADERVVVGRDACSRPGRASPSGRPGRRGCAGAVIRPGEGRKSWSGSSELIRHSNAWPRADDLGLARTAAARPRRSGSAA